MRFSCMKSLSLFASLLSVTCLGAGAENLQKRPNIILIFADDLGYGDVGPFGSTKNRTPHLDEMAKEGMKLTSFYAAPVCTPSRAQVLTGCYAKRVSLPDVIFPACPIGLDPKEQTLGKLMKSAGYATMCIGKWHVGDQAEFLPTRQGFDHYFGLPYSNDMGGSDAPPLPGAKKKGNGRPPLPLVRDDRVIETLTPADQDALTARYTEEALKFIHDNKERPFFLYLPHTAVHLPIHPGDPFKGKSANGPYGDWVEELDWSIGRIIDTLRELKLAENTLVIFSSDNGPQLGQTRGGVATPLRGGKFSTLEGGMREPTVAWWPGHVPAGTTCDAVAGNIDFLPTFAALGGASLAKDVNIDGRDIMPLLAGESRESPRKAQFYFRGNCLEAIRSGPWKLAIVPESDHKSKKTDPPSSEFKPILYNLDTDIGETADVATEHPDVVAHLQKFATDMDTDLGLEKIGPGVRPPGRVAHPAGLRLPAEISNLENTKP
jgi:arylsulfatase A